MTRRVRRAAPAILRDQWAPLLTARLGMSMAAHRWEVCEPAIRAAMAVAGVSDPSHYRWLVEHDAAAFDALAEAVTVGETYFFRDPQQFEFLRRTAIPALHAQHGEGAPLVVWSAGCATGEEPYSLAILVREMGLAGCTRVYGTDASRARLSRARRASYTRWSLRGVPEATVDRWFRRHHGRYELVEPIRSAVEFAPFTFAREGAEPPVRSAHLIMCRNVFIYLDRDTMVSAARELVSRLAVGGWLVLGPSDPPLYDLIDCEVVTTGAGLVYRRADGRRRSHRAPARSAAPPRPTGPSPAALARPAQPNVATGVVAPVTRSASAEPPPAELAPAELLVRARSRLHAGDYLAAAELAQRYVEQAPRMDAEGWVILVRALANLGREQVAARACTTALLHHPHNAELSVLSALLMMRLDRLPDAITSARRALYLDRQLAMGHFVLGSALAKQGHTGEARRAIRRALQLLECLAGDAPVPASGGESAARLASAARSQLVVLGGSAP